MAVKLIPLVLEAGQVQEHGDFVAVRKFDAIDAIGPDNGQQVLPGDDLEAETLEKFRRQGQEEDFA